MQSAASVAVLYRLSLGANTSLCFRMLPAAPHSRASYRLHRNVTMNTFPSWYESLTVGVSAPTLGDTMQDTATLPEEKG